MFRKLIFPLLYVFCLLTLTSFTGVSGYSEMVLAKENYEADNIESCTGTVYAIQNDKYHFWGKHFTYYTIHIKTDTDTVAIDNGTTKPEVSRKDTVTLYRCSPQNEWELNIDDVIESDVNITNYILLPMCFVLLVGIWVGNRVFGFDI